MRLLMPVVVFLLSDLTLPVAAQTGAGGHTSISGTLDPNRVPPSLATPNAMPRRMRGRFASADFAARQAALVQRRPGILGPVFVEVRAPLARNPLTPQSDSLFSNPTINFEGIGQTIFVPPSPDIAVGPEDVLLTVHSSIGRYSRNGQQLSLMTLQQFFSSIIPTVCPVGGSAGCHFFDPSIRYDSLHGRFLLLAFSLDVATERTYFVLSVSNGATYASGWRHWALRGNLNGTTETPYEVDFPQVGYDNNAVYLTANMFDALNTLRYAKLRILRKSELYNPATTTLTYRDLWDLRNADNTVATTLRPAQLRGSPGTGTPPGILVNASDVPNASYLTLWRIENPTSDTPSAVRTTLSGVWAYDYPAAFPSLGSTQYLSAGDSAVLKAILRNGILYTARNTGYVNTPTTVTYDRIELATNAVTLQARYVGGHFFYPAFDVPASHGPANAPPSKLITGSSTDNSGALTYIGIPGVIAGEDSYSIFNGRWGDYFGGAIDPVYGGLWVYGEYAKRRSGPNGVWGTRCAYFPWATSPQFTDVSSSSPFADYINVIRLWGITSGCGAQTFCPQDPVTREQMAAFLVRAVLGADSFTFPTTPYFTDVAASHPYFRYIQKLRELGITQGCSPTAFCPSNRVSREQMAAFLVKAKLRSLHGDNFPFPSAPFFSDVSASSPFFPYIQKLRELGITQGCGSGSTFCPASDIRREEMAVFLARAFLN